jgi:hypothetical protein
MAYHIKDPETDRIIRELAKIKQQPIAVVIKEACRKELEQERHRWACHVLSKSRGRRPTWKLC